MVQLNDPTLTTAFSKTSTSMELVNAALLWSRALLIAFLHTYVDSGIWYPIDKENLHKHISNSRWERWHLPGYWVASAERNMQIYYSGSFTDFRVAHDMNLSVTHVKCPGKLHENQGSLCWNSRWISAAFSIEWKPWCSFHEFTFRTWRTAWLHLEGWFQIGDTPLPGLGITSSTFCLY